MLLKNVKLNFKKTKKGLEQVPATQLIGWVDVWVRGYVIDMKPTSTPTPTPIPNDWECSN